MVTEEGLRAIVKSLPEASLIQGWGHIYMQVGRRVFMRMNGAGTQASVRLSVTDWLSSLIGRENLWRDALRPCARPGWFRFNPVPMNVEAVGEIAHEAWHHATYRSGSKRTTATTGTGAR